MESCSRSSSARAPRARAAVDGGAAPAESSSPPESVPPIALRSSPTEKCGPLAAKTTARTVVSPLTAAMARGRSRHRSVPMALRASGRSSHTVATDSSCSMLSTGDSNVAISSMAPKIASLDRQARRGPAVAATKVHELQSHAVDRT